MFGLCLLSLHWFQHSIYDLHVMLFHKNWSLYYNTITYSLEGQPATSGLFVWKLHCGNKPFIQYVINFPWLDYSLSVWPNGTRNNNTRSFINTDNRQSKKTKRTYNQTYSSATPGKVLTSNILKTITWT